MSDRDEHIADIVTAYSRALAGRSSSGDTSEVGPMLFGREPDQFRGVNGGVQYRFLFPNGKGASVVKHSFSYGGDEGLWELAVVDHNGKLLYDTPITDDVIGRMTVDDVIATLAKIEALS